MGRLYLSATALGAIVLTITLYADYAYIHKPVVDLFSSSDIPHGEIAIAPASPTSPYPPRINQALFNELYEIIKKEKNATRIRIPWAIYGYDATSNPQDAYWIRNSDFILINKNTQENVLSTIPALSDEKNIITLKRPFTDQTGTTYSIGTQFIDTQNIPREYIFEPARNVNKRTQFVRLITELANYNQPIHYVWGGSSFINNTQSKPYTGYDCSNLIVRFARMTEIPYYFKTTTMLEKYGKPFTSHDALEIGDLIWLQGHVIIITDIDKVLVTESSGYFNNVGKLRTEKLSCVLKDMNSWDDLIRAYRGKKEIVRLDGNGQPYNLSRVKIFKLF